MSGSSKIEWTEATWNPIVGCSIVSPGCTNCYAMKMARRIELMGTAAHYAGTTKVVNGNAIWTGKLALAPERILLEPLRRKKPTTYFVNSMGDLFHEDVPDEWIDRVFAVMALAPQHTFQVLTKRAERMRAYCTGLKDRAVEVAQQAVWLGIWDDPDVAASDTVTIIDAGPLPNVWLGVSTEDQERANARIPDLLATPAAIRFISAEPLIGPIDLTAIKAPHIPGTPDDSDMGWTFNALTTGDYYSFEDDRGYNEGGDGPYREHALDWVIVGGESGPSARPMHPDWARSLRDQCAAAGVSFFFKQWGEWVPQVGGVDGWTIDDNPEISRFDHRDWNGDQWGRSYRPMWCDERDDDTVSRVGKKAAGRLLDGIEHNAMPGRAA